MPTKKPARGGRPKMKTANPNKREVKIRRAKYYAYVAPPRELIPTQLQPSVSRRPVMVVMGHGADRSSAYFRIDSIKVGVGDTIALEIGGEPEHDVALVVTSRASRAARPTLITLEIGGEPAHAARPTLGAVVPDDYVSPPDWEP